MEKQANNLPNKTVLKSLIKIICTVFLFTISLTGNAQVEGGKKYLIKEINVTGNTNFSAQTIIAYSKLRKDEEIQIGGEKIANAVKTLWKSNLFSSIDIYVTDIEGSTANLEIRLIDLPELLDLTIEGIKKGKKDEVVNENNLQSGQKVTENLIATTRNYLTNKYKKKGFLNTKVNISTSQVIDSVEKERVNMRIKIDKGQKVKIKAINFVGNEKIKGKKLRKAMKNTKKKNFIRLLKRSKYIEEDFKEDLVSVIDYYKENGYRDARIISDSIIYNDEKTISLNIKVEEGEKYTFGKITFVGNTVYTDQQLANFLQIKEGDTYNGVELRERIADPSNPDAQDLTNAYQNTGYMFSTINPVEVSAEGNVIDMEIRIVEGKPAYYNNITVSGNDVTNDHVIYREIRTRPGELYQKSEIIRTLRELGQLGFFDAQQLVPDVKNPNPVDGTLDIDYKVVEQGSSQIQLQGGYGGGGFIGTLGLSFNNFAIKDIFKKEAYKPVPRGDGQSLALRLQASQFFQTYSFSFSEPWLGGKKPYQLSTSISHSKQFLYNSATRKADKSRKFDITGVTVGLSTRLSEPDDYFVLSQALSYQHYNLKNYNTGLFTFGDGTSNNLSYTIGLSRSNLSIDPIFPTAGSNFSVSAKFSFPYSLVNGVDYGALKEERDGLDPTDVDDFARIGEIDQERYKWLEFYKIKFKADWYTSLTKKLVLRPSMEFGFLGAYNNDRGVIPFERFFVGGDGLGNFSLDGREVIQLRGYPNQSLSSTDGGSIYNKFSLELRYPITLGAQAKIYALSFLEAGQSINDFKDFNPFELKRSAGFGLRIFMPAFGLLGIDFGHAFDNLPDGSSPKKWETHFIIGQQF
ncbi:outer membrane protein assembly factor BamA [Winogradskyella echinorum]|uniref:Outer membrane protein assembly factor BamA n=1 Tax=Winogradskyella echinorum TaxID=538189 RepID=A0ABR6Y556_9FLAO|nr:outer membrane protein assembly factor BamA [Winogradskyella echinorum]MBC3847370.1 outer membrane protein assembly factor BamA [Winogradskyella echinorum]MBC5751718.1 outer membrane protein assembly factor BamA [Winogradskyella echinorum]